MKKIPDPLRIDAVNVVKTDSPPYIQNLYSRSRIEQGKKKFVKRFGSIADKCSHSTAVAEIKLKSAPYHAIR